MACSMTCAVMAFCAAPAAELLPQRKILAQEKSPFALITVSEADGKRYISIGGQEQEIGSRSGQQAALGL